MLDPIEFDKVIQLIRSDVMNIRQKKVLYRESLLARYRHGLRRSSTETIQYGRRATDKIPEHFEHHRVTASNILKKEVNHD